MRLKSNKAFTYVEASIIFPVALLVVFLVLYIGDAYYQKAWMSAEVSRSVIRGSNDIADPLSATIMDNAGVVDNDDLTGQTARFPSNLEMRPYRYFCQFTNCGSQYNDVTNKEKSKIQQKVNQGYSSIFGINVLRPQIDMGFKKSAFASSYTIKVTNALPLSFLDKTYDFGFSSYDEAQANSVNATYQVTSLINYLSKRLGLDQLTKVGEVLLDVIPVLGKVFGVGLLP